MHSPVNNFTRQSCHLWLMFAIVHCHSVPPSVRYVTASLVFFLIILVICLWKHFNQHHPFAASKMEKILKRYGYCCSEDQGNVLILSATH